MSALQKNEVLDDISYAPQIRVTVNKEDLTDKVLADIIELRVTLDRDELGAFTMHLANHFEIDETSEPDKDGNTRPRRFRHSDDNTLEFRTPVTIEMGYAGRLETMFIGEITMLQPGFPSSGVPTFTVTGTDIMHRFRDANPGSGKSKAYTTADWKIAEEIARRHDLAYAKSSVHEGSPHGTVMQKDQDDLKFLKFLAHRNEYECSIILEGSTPALYFGPPTDKRDGRTETVVTLTYGQTLSSFNPKLSIGRQVGKVTVRGWDARKKEPIEYTATMKDISKKGQKGKAGAEYADAKEERIVNHPVYSLAEAKAIAKEILQKRANEYLTGSGEAMGEPLLKPGVIVDLQEIGTRYSGSYYVKKTEHVFGASGYMTTFEVTRDREGEQL